MVKIWAILISFFENHQQSQITSNDYLSPKDDIVEGDLNRPEMKAKLV